MEERSEAYANASARVSLESMICLSHVSFSSVSGHILAFQLLSTFVPLFLVQIAPNFESFVVLWWKILSVRQEIN